MEILTRLGQIGVCTLGAFFLLILTGTVVGEMPLFTDPRFDGFWDDVEAYHLKLDARKTPAELSRQYGTKPVIQYILSPGLGAAYLPSERAAFINVVVYTLSEEHKESRLLLPGLWGTMLIAMYMPMVLVARQAQGLFSWLVCRSRNAREAREAYFAAIKQPRLKALAAVFGLTLALSLCDALTLRSPEMRQRGVMIFDLAGWLLVMAYFGGLWMRLLLYAVDIGFLAAGLNPHRSLWDVVIAIAVIAPILSFVFQNSWLTIATTASAALAAELFVKWTVRHHETTVERQLSPTELTEGFPRSAETFGQTE